MNLALSVAAASSCSDVENLGAEDGTADITCDVGPDQYEITAFVTDEAAHVVTAQISAKGWYAKAGARYLAYKPLPEGQTSKPEDVSIFSGALLKPQQHG